MTYSWASVLPSIVLLISSASPGEAVSCSNLDALECNSDCSGYTLCSNYQKVPLSCNTGTVCHQLSSSQIVCSFPPTNVDRCLNPTTIPTSSAAPTVTESITQSSIQSLIRIDIPSNAGYDSITCKPTTTFTKSNSSCGVQPNYEIFGQLKLIPLRCIHECAKLSTCLCVSYAIDETECIIYKL